jgi:hypothetical protein
VVVLTTFAPPIIKFKASPTNELILAQPNQSTIVFVEISISPTAFPSMLYSSVTAAPAPTIDQPFVVLKALSFTCGECPEPYPEPPAPI